MKKNPFFMDMPKKNKTMPLVYRLVSCWNSHGFNAKKEIFSHISFQSHLIISKHFTNQAFFFCPEFMNFFGIVYIASTTLILIFKNEKNKSYEKYTNANSMSIGETYSLLWNILKLKPIGLLMILMLTANVIKGPNPQTGIP